MALPARYPHPVSVAAANLACSRGGRLVFAGLTFALRPGELLALTGPNGSGKSSLLRILAGLLEPGEGRVEVSGGTAAERQGRLHYLGHLDALKPALTLAETLRFWALLGGGRVTAGDLDVAATAVGLAHVLDLPTGILSAGQRRRAGLARLILKPRPLWLLDEPSAALDGAGEQLLGDLVGAHLRAGGCAVAATHGALPVAPSAELSFGRAA